MHYLPTCAVLFVSRVSTHPLLTYLEQLQPIQLERADSLPADLSPYSSLIIADDDSLTWSAEMQAQLADYVNAGGTVLSLSGLSEQPLPPLFGARIAPIGPQVELRVLFTERQHPIGTRLPDAFFVQGRYQPLEPTADDVTTLLYADWRYTHQPVLTVRPVGQGVAAVTTLQDFEEPHILQIMYRLLRQFAKQPLTGQTLNVGVLGYAPSVGQLHAQGCEATDGLALTAACDLSPARLEAARQQFPHLKLFDDSEAFANDADIDVVIIATPPSTHAKLTIQMLEAGKHVICEKPLAFNQAELTAMKAAAEQNQRHLSCHQNRRWDVDYLAVKQAMRQGLLGEVFYLDTFVGSYNHPCAFWHSHDKISGGTTYDWGAHYLDWVLSLLPDTITAVIGTRQNRLWHDITNADQERIQLRFANGQEAEFTHSDIAAIPKPKWYLLGTEGALVSEWQHIRTHEIDPVLYFNPHDIPPTEMPPTLKLRRLYGEQFIDQTLPTPPRQSYPFHRNLADFLLLGEPIVASYEDSARVVRVLEAAAKSAEQGGTVQQVEI